MRKLILVLCVVIIILIPLVGLKFANDQVYKYSRQAVQHLMHQKDFEKFSLQKLSLGDARLELPNKLVWEKVSSELVIKEQPAYFQTPGVVVTADRLILELADVFERRFFLSGKELRVTPLPVSDNNELGENIDERLERGSFHLSFAMDFMDPVKAKAQLQYLKKETLAFIQTGRTAFSFNFRGIIFFSIDNRLVDTKITTMHSDDGNYIIRVNKSFFKTMADQHNDEITDAEAELLSVNPFKMPKLIEIMRKARKESEKYAGSPDIPEDAYRHVLWSYLLTREFGHEFAQQITDAHEEGDLDNTRAEHIMDYNNNAVGRKYALRQYKEEYILDKILKDPEVIFMPE